ncbi:hypothetical protein ZWY2020_015211 [Hordeum vulgare]|nr:hypothetical protein ZWY2020_015211 [Hordeum vulgare]
MADPATLQLLPDLVLEEIFVRLPPNDFHRCRCVSRAWAATLSSDDVIDRHLSLRGKIRLDYDDIMSGLLLDCCIHDCDDYADRLASDISREKESDVAAATEETTDEVGDGDGKTFLREFDTYRWPWPIPQQGQDDIGAFDDGEDDEESDAVNL